MTVLMHSWYYEKKDLKRTPSIVAGLDIEKENRYRREGARFIINVGTKMGLRYDTMATGVVYFHRFYMFHSFQTFPRYVTACCCLFLAGKVEETPKKCKDIIRTAKTFLGESQFAQFGDDPKEEVMTLERILLQTIKFDLQVDHPYGHLLKYAKSLKGDKNKLQHMVQMAWTFINDSLCTTLCLQWEPEVIAIALMYLAGKLSKFEVVDWVGRTPKHDHWWDMFVEGMSIELLEDICHQVLDLYSMPVPKTTQDSPPATPPTKSTRKISQPPSPVETSTSPAQVVKAKEPPPPPPPPLPVVGQPIPRLEPGELKRKVSQTDVSKEPPEPKKIPCVEGKAIPTITRHSPKASSSKAAPSSLDSNIQSLSPPSPPKQKPIKVVKETARVTSEPVFKSDLASSDQDYASGSYTTSDTSTTKMTLNIPQASITTYAVTVPAAPVSTYTQPAPSYYSDAQPYPTIQPPPQIYSQRPPLPFQHPPPSGPPPSMPPHQYSSGIPPYNSQYPPPRQPLPPGLLATPMPPGVPPSHPPMGGMMHNIPPPPPGIHSVRHMDNMYGPPTDAYSSDQRGHNPKQQSQEHGAWPRFDGNYRPRRELDGSFPHETRFRRPPPNRFERPPHPGRRFPLDQQKKPERGPAPAPTRSNAQQPSGPTGIPPVRITGSN